MNKNSRRIQENYWGESAVNWVKNAPSAAGHAMAELGAEIGYGLFGQGIEDGVASVAPREYTDEGPHGAQSQLQRDFGHDPMVAGLTRRFLDIPNAYKEILYQHALEVGTAATLVGVYTGAGSCISSAAALITAIEGFFTAMGLPEALPLAALIGYVWGGYCEAQVIVSGVISAFEFAGGIQVILEKHGEFTRGATRFCGRPNWLNNSTDPIAAECNIPYDPDYLSIVPNSMRQGICNNAATICGINAVTKLGGTVGSYEKCLEKVANYTSKLIEHGVAPQLAAGIASTSGSLCARKVAMQTARGLTPLFGDDECAGNLQITWCGQDGPPTGVTDYRDQKTVNQVYGCRSNPSESGCTSRP